MASAPVQIPDKSFFKIGEVCRLTETQPYVLRFWESEFPSLVPQKTRAGQRLYRRADIQMVLRIKQLLYEESYTIAGARKQLEHADAGPPLDQPAPRTASRTSKGAMKKGRVGVAMAPAAAAGAGGEDKRLTRVRRELRELLDLLEGQRGSP